MVKSYATGLEIKKKVISALKEGQVSLRKLETRLNIGYMPLKRHCQELEFLGILTIRLQKQGSKNGRPYTTIELTKIGRELLRKL